MVGWYVCLVRLGGGVVKFVRGLGSSCGVWCMNVDWIVMVYSCGGGGDDVCVIRVVIVVRWLGSGGEGMVVVVLVMR